MILVVEDEERLRSLVARSLRQDGFEVREAKDGAEALDVLGRDPFELLVLDWVLPFKSGLDVLQELRARANVIPVLMVTARDAIDNRIQALDAGADDYLTKPFNLAELSARVRALLRRTSGRAERVLRCGDLVLSPRSRIVERSGRQIVLTAREFSLLQYFLEHQGQVLSRKEIVEAVWDHDFETFSNVVDVFVRHLRVKLEAGDAAPLLHTVRGVGYVMRAS